MKATSIRGVVRGGKVDVDLPDGTEVTIIPEADEHALTSDEIAAIAAATPPFIWSDEDEAEWRAERARRGLTPPP